MSVLVQSAQSREIVIFEGKEVKTYKYKNLRVYYRRPGSDHSVPTKDVNRNGVPDVVENVAIGFDSVLTVFHHLYKFPRPTHSSRYGTMRPLVFEILMTDTKEEVTKRVVQSVKDQSKTHGFTYIGATFSVPTPALYDPSKYSFKVTLAIDEALRTSILAHEYFHLIQRTMVSFNNGWLIEGTARWAEDSVVDHTQFYKKKDLSEFFQNQTTRKRLFVGQYNVAADFWQPLINLCQDYSRLSNNLIIHHNYVNGTPVFEDADFHGAKTIHRLYRCLESIESQVGSSEVEANKNSDEWILKCAYRVYKQCAERRKNR